MTKNLQSRKRQLVQDAIYDAAIDLFAQNGFDETTVEEVADAAGISRRSFFRYFATKDDLLALNTVHCGEVLVKTVASCPASLAPLEVVRETVRAGVKFTESQKHTHQIIDIAARSVSARQAHMSRWMEVEDDLAAAYGTRTKGVAKDYMRLRLLAGTTLLILNTATAAWFMGEYKDLSTAAKQGFLNLARLLGDESGTSWGMEGASGGKAHGSLPSKKSRVGKK
jgi:AcrR family transcriptional regulator